MIISRDEAIKMLNNSNNLLHNPDDVEQDVIAEIVEDLIAPDRPILHTPKGTNRRIPPIFREMIAIQSNLTGHSTQVAEAYGISAAHSHQLKHGQVSPNQHIATNGQRASDVALAAALEASLGKVRSKALDKIYASMDAIVDEDLPNQQPKILATIAANLSRVVSATLRDKRDGPVVNVQTVFYSPEKASKEQYEVIDV